MKIVFVTTGTLSTYGTTYRTLGLAYELHKKNLDVHVLIPGWPENRSRFAKGQYRGVPLHFCDAGAWSEMASKYDLLGRLRPDIVHSSGVVKRCFLPAFAYRQIRSCRLVVDNDEDLSHVYSFPKSWYASCALRIAIRYADQNVVASRSLEDWYAEKHGKNVLYLPNAVDLEFFDEHRTGSESVRSDAAGNKIITYLGNLHPRYEADLVVDAAERVLQNRKDVTFNFVGTGPLLESLRDRTKRLKLEAHIRWFGFIPDEDVPRHLTASDIVVLPIRDSWINRARCPGKIYQYIAAEIPIVTNRVGEVAETLGDMGVYFEPGDADDFARVLQHVLDSPESTRRPSRDLALRHTWERRAEAYLDFINAYSEQEVSATCSEDKRSLPYKQH